MDVKIENGDVCIDDSGNYVMIDGFDEVVQQVLIKITSEKGSFIYDRNLGSECTLSKTLSDKPDIKVLEMLINESLAHMEDVYVKLTDAYFSDGKLIMKITIFWRDLSEEKEVTI